MSDFRVRALELHSRYVWDFDWVRKALDFIEANQLTALILHRNDIVDRIVWPSRFFGGATGYKNIFERYRDIHRSLYKYTPTRRSGPYHRREYLRRVIELAKRRGIEVYFQNKELWFHEIFLELNPQLTKNGTICPNESFWWEFVETKYTELFEELPHLTGIITAPGTGESRLAISSNRCGCELCRKQTPSGWYTNLVTAMHKPIRKAGKLLAVRDFVFNKAAQEELAKAIENLPSDIVISLKNTPHDYYPTFPDNPRLGRVGNHPQWVEYDTMAQYFGWGTSPAVMIEDYRRRMAVARQAGAEGVVLRTDWESLDGHTCFHTTNIVNAYAGAALSRDGKTPARDIYARWLAEQGALVDDAPATRNEAGAWAEKLLARSWDVISRALYMNGCVFNDSSTFPISLAHALWLAEEKNSLKDWDPSKKDALAPTEANVRKILAEKDEALAILEQSMQALASPPDSIRPQFIAELRTRFDIARRYIRGFRAIGRAWILARFLVEGSPASFRAEAQRLFAAGLQELMLLAAEFDEFAATTDHRYTVYVALSGERLRTLHDDLVRQVQQRGGRAA